MANVSGEKRYEQVFGDTFALYSRKEMVEFIEPFRVRFARNGLESKDIFSGKNCFDGGCGNGRGSLFMLMNGAAKVTAFDYSEKNVESTLKFADQFGFTNIDVHQGSLASIPFTDQSFDVVWCNGVVMHTEKPNECLAELARILKLGGKMWLYVYGSGGVYWRIIYHLREMVKHIDINTCMSVLKLFRYETRYIAEFIDDWYATWLRTYTHEDMSLRLQDLGFRGERPLPLGMDYDTSHRLNSVTSIEERVLMGEGDLRYLLTKDKHVCQQRHLLEEGEYGSQYHYPDIIRDRIDPLMESVRVVAKDRDWMKIALAAHIQRELRILLYETGPFPFVALQSMIKCLAEQAAMVPIR